MGGLRKYMPITFATMMAGWLAISGIPIFAGFFSKDEILWKVWSAGAFNMPNPVWNKLLWFVAALTALLTAVYMTRMMVMTFGAPSDFAKNILTTGPLTRTTMRLMTTRIILIMARMNHTSRHGL